MSAYTIGEVAIWLLLAAVLGFALGWLARELALRARPTVPAGSAAPAVDAAPAEDAAPVGDPAPVKDVVRGDDRDASGAVPDETSSAALDPVTPGPHPGSALPMPDGSAPSGDHVVKVSRGSKIYHAPSSPSYARTTAAIWFISPQAAEEAGFRKPKNG